MGVIVNKDRQMDNELGRRIDADLRARAMAGADEGGAGEGGETPDFAEDAEYVRNLKRTSKFGWVWIVLIVLAIGAVVAIVVP